VATIKLAQIVCDDLNLPLASAACLEGFDSIADLSSS
jgi:hypothetical protein